VLWDWINNGLSASPPSKFNLASIRALLRPDEAILYYFWINQSTLLIAVIERDGFAVELRSISAEHRTLLDAYADNALASEFTKPNFTAFEPVSKFGALLLPDNSRTAWHRKQRLLISPHRVLHSIPFHAMRYDGRWLIERAAISYIANLSSLELTYTARKDRRTLIAGVENFNVRGKSLRRLPDADVEAIEVKEIYDDHRMPATLLLEGEATAGRLREMESAGTLKDYSCLHFATHGENVNSNSPMEARFYLQESFLDGLELASLQAAFFRAGAHHIIGTLWPVNSSAARRISTGFHARIAADRQCDPEIALQASVCDYLSTANIQTGQIFFWAPFFLSSLGRAKTT
jgi:CHAT domain-containing protein